MDIDEPAIKQALRQDQGVALTRAVRFLGIEHVDIFRQKQIDGYIITLGSEEAEGMYMPANESDSDELVWHAPSARQNQHVELIVQDADDLRFVPYLMPTATITDKAGTVIAETELRYMWHPVASHYGSNVALPDEGPFSYRICFAAPNFHRHDEVLGNRLTRPVDVTFENIRPELAREPRCAD